AAARHGAVEVDAAAAEGARRRGVAGDGAVLDQQAAVVVEVDAAALAGGDVARDGAVAHRQAGIAEDEDAAAAAPVGVAGQRHAVQGDVLVVADAAAGAAGDRQP